MQFYAIPSGLRGSEQLPTPQNRRLRARPYGRGLFNRAPGSFESNLAHRRGLLKWNTDGSLGFGLLAGAIRVRLQLRTIFIAENYGTATWRYWQRIRNDAGPRRTYRARPPFPVRARLLFEHDGAV